MYLYLRQEFPLGRFHATRWKQGAYGDPYGEWPPSPWRFLRALANRWFQWSRETGDIDKERLMRLLQSLSCQVPEFYITPHSWRGEPIKQYQPTQVTWTNASKKASAYKKPKSSLIEDHYRLIPPQTSIYWLWENLDTLDTDLLDVLLARILYFGRAESWTKLSRISSLPNNPGEHCVLSEKRFTNAVPVLAADPKQQDNLRLLFEPTEHEEIKNKEIPSGTRWFYTSLPSKPQIVARTKRSLRYPEDLTCIQFVIGGRVLPKIERWPIVTGHFRNQILARLTESLSYNIAKLSIEVKEKIKGISGKDCDGQRLKDHSHAFISIIPDEYGQPARLVIWRSTPFSRDEIAAMMMASEKPIGWDYATPKWMIKLLPLPFDMEFPLHIDGSCQCWESVTPFIPPRQRRRYRKNGKLRAGESADMVAEKLLNKVYGIDVARIDVGEMSWITGHMNSVERRTKGQRIELPGFHLVLHFNEPVTGPIALGDSSHYGMGLFRPKL